MRATMFRCISATLVIASVLLAIRFFPKAPLSSRFSSSTAVYDSENRLLRLTLSGDDKYRLWVPLEEISPVLKEAFILHEDKYFYWHFALNPASLARAAWKTYFAGGRRTGGSTITMQTARLIYRINSRTVFGKIKQITRAVELELLYSKDEILEAYLNLVPYGRNIEGVGAASLIYYGKNPDSVTLPEALSLATVPQSPARRAIGGQNLAAVAAVRASLFDKWVKIHPAGAEYEPLIKMQLSIGDIEGLPFLAPHFVNSVLSRARGTKEIKTTLDNDLQKILERHAKSFVSRMKPLGINNASAMLLDYRAMEVKALLGSADFFNAEIEGQVNGTAAKRSPGSALKPFVYALGIDQGILHPMTILKDAPTTVGSFNPENFDGKFAGPITAKEALIRSRNIPAITIAQKLSSPNFYEFLKMAGVSGLKSERHYGPSIVIGGGGEVTMEEMVALYAALANRGMLRPVRYLLDDPVSGGIRVLSEEASFMTLDMLKDNPRPDQFYERKWTSDSMPVYWKTGTSYGFRDAWSVGIFGPYVLAVWIGNFNGEGNQSFVGIRAAAPLFFQIIDSIKAHKNSLAEPVRLLPANLKKVEVCAVSGGLPGAFCRRKKMTWFIPGKSPIKVCDIHREIVVSDESGLQACPPHAGRTHAEVREFWPSDLMKIFQWAGIPRQPPPPFERDCQSAVQSAKGPPPKITSPQAGVTYTLRSSSPANETISFLATTDAGSSEVYWFMNEGYIGKTESGAAFLWNATPGKYVVRAVDEMGRSDARELKVAVVQ